MLYSSQSFIKIKIITVTSIFLPNRNMKIKNFKDFENLKAHRNLNIFHEASL